MKTGNGQKYGNTVVKKEDSDFSPLSAAKHRQIERDRQRERESDDDDDDNKEERSE